MLGKNCLHALLTVASHWSTCKLPNGDNGIVIFLQHSMIFFFHRYELPALLEQIRQQQQQPMPPHHNEQAPDGHAGPDRDAPPTDDSDHGSPFDTEAEQEEAGVSDASEANNVTADAFSTIVQQSSVDDTVQGCCVNVADHNVQQLCLSHSVGVVAEATQQSAALTQPTLTSSSFHSPAVMAREDDYGFCTVSEEETHVYCDMPFSPSSETTDVIHHVAAPADDIGLASVLAVDSSMGLRRRYQVPDSGNPSTSHRAFTNCQELHADRPSGERTMNSEDTATDSSDAEMQ